MRPVSEKFLDTIRGSHRMVAEARVCAPGQTGVNPVGTKLDIIDGNVIIDGTASIRSTLDLRIDGTQRWPDERLDELPPYGNEIFVRRGVVYGNITEWVSLGYFRIEDIEQDTPPDGPIRITGLDRMAGIIEADVLSPKQYRVPYSRAQVVNELVLSLYPWAVIEWDSAGDANTSIGAGQVTGEKRFDFLDDLMVAAGKIWYWDYRGVLVIRDPPNPQNPVWDINAGRDGVLSSMNRRLTRAGVYNGVKVIGEPANDSPPVWATVVDRNSQSPTRWGGNFGQVPLIWSSPKVTSTNEATRAAQALLVQSIGLPYSVDLTSIPNCALEPFDPFTLHYPARSRVTGLREEQHIIDALTIPLTADQIMPVRTRQLQLILTGGPDD